MKYHFISAALAATLLLLGASPSLASEDDENHVAAAGNAKGKAAHSAHADKSKAKLGSRKLKLVDINSAKKAELKKLHGIGDAEADKIIAGRPYGSKAWLVSDNVLSQDAYLGIAGSIEAKQPFKDGAKNVEFLKEAAARKEKEKKEAEQKAGGKK